MAARALSASCAATLNSWCDANCIHAREHGPLIAAFDANAQNAQRAWRCYAPSTLRAGRYHSGSTYCTRHEALARLVDQCDTDQPRSTASPPSPEAVAVSALGHQQPASRTVHTAPALPSFDATVELKPWSPGQLLTVPAVDTQSWSSTASHELFQVQAWEVPCIDSYERHKLKNYTGNVSAKKAFLDRTGLSCHGRCVRGVVDGFATHAEIDEMMAAVPEPDPSTAAISTWRWEPPDEPAVFRMLIARAQAVMAEHYGVRNLRFYRSNIIRWKGADAPRQAWPKHPHAWRPRSLHGDTNTDEMFHFTTILYLSQHGVDVNGGETGIADVIDGSKRTTTAGLRIEPSIGRLLIFSAGVENMHEMLPVTHGERIACQMWFACEGLNPGWAYSQREAWAAQYGYGGPDGSREVPPAPRMSTRLQKALKAPWPWRRAS